MTAAAPLIEISGVLKHYPALRPLRIAALRVAASDRLVLSGFDAAAAEVFIHLVTGASLPDEGEIRIDGRSTRDIATDTEWLVSLDRFGIVTHRAVLIDAIPIAQNLALPMTLSIDPMPAEIRGRVEQIARDAGLDVARIDEPARTLSDAERLRVHFARAMANDPALILLEHPTAPLSGGAQSAEFGQIVAAAARARGFGFVALSEDESFAAASGGARLFLKPATGKIAKRGWFG
jgi:ABC-type transporter Mla maintaining outer membrane lipid asymmetry ATPase subunit MlaF